MKTFCSAAFMFLIDTLESYITRLNHSLSPADILFTNIYKTFEFSLLRALFYRSIETKTTNFMVITLYCEYHCIFIHFIYLVNFIQWFAFIFLNLEEKTNKQTRKKKNALNYGYFEDFNLDIFYAVRFVEHLITMKNLN